MKIVLTFFFVISVYVATYGQEGQKFSLKELYDLAGKEQKRYLRFIDNENLSSGIYQLNVGDVDDQQPHKWDEIYYILEGKAQLIVADEMYSAKSGDILFVAAEVGHRFIDIQEDLKVLVFFTKKE